MSSNLLGSWNACFLAHSLNKCETIDLSSTQNLLDSKRRIKLGINISYQKCSTHQNWKHNLFRKPFPLFPSANSINSAEASSNLLWWKSFCTESTSEGWTFGCRSAVDQVVPFEVSGFFDCKSCVLMSAYKPKISFIHTRLKMI